MPPPSSDQASQIWVFTRRSDSKGLRGESGSSTTPPRRKRRPYAPSSSAPTKVRQGLHLEHHDHHSRFQVRMQHTNPRTWLTLHPAYRGHHATLIRSRCPSHLPGHRGSCSSGTTGQTEKSEAARKGINAHADQDQWSSRTSHPQPSMHPREGAPGRHPPSPHTAEKTQPSHILLLPDAGHPRAAGQAGRSAPSTLPEPPTITGPVGRWSPDASSDASSRTPIPS